MNNVFIFTFIGQFFFQFFFFSFLGLFSLFFPCFLLVEIRLKIAYFNFFSTKINLFCFSCSLKKYVFTKWLHLPIIILFKSFFVFEKKRKVKDCYPGKNSTFFSLFSHLKKQEKKMISLKIKIIRKKR